MKKTTIRGLIAVIAITLQTNFAIAQWTPVPAFPGNFVRTNNITWAAGIGVGTAISPTPTPLSILHIDSRGINPLTTINRGEVFRTDCPAADSPFWRMLRGGTNFGNIYNPTGTSSFVMEAAQPLGNIQFRTRQFFGPSTTRMIITDGTFAGIGFVGIGNNFLTPQSSP